MGAYKVITNDYHYMWFYINGTHITHVVLMCTSHIKCTPCVHDHPWAWENQAWGE